MIGVGVVGGGIVGLACARALLLLRPGLDLVVWERELSLALHQSGRSSSVLHSGLYYAPGSLRADMCVRGADMARQFVKEENRNVPAMLEAGKLIIATREEELPRLEQLMHRGMQNKVRDLVLMDKEDLRKRGLESGIAAIWSPHTGIIDWQAFCLEIAKDIVRLGGKIECAADPEAYKKTNRFVLNCAGLQADKVAIELGGKQEPRLIPIRGNFVRLDPPDKFLPLSVGMIYPVPDPNFPFLGVHLTRKLDGSVYAGPGASLSLARNHYETLNVKDLINVASWPGFWRLTFKNLGFCTDQLIASVSTSAFVKQTKRFVPDANFSHVTGKKFGIRALAVNRDGSIVEDFVFEMHGSRAMSVRNAPSPAATSCLAIGERVASIVNEYL